MQSDDQSFTITLSSENQPVLQWPATSIDSPSHRVPACKSFGAVRKAGSEPNVEILADFRFGFQTGLDHGRGQVQEPTE